MTDNFLEKSLPSSQESEQVVLGGPLLDNSLFAEAHKKLKDADFYSPVNRRVFQSMSRLYEKGSIIDPILIGEDLKAHGEPIESMGGVASITNLTFGLPKFDVVSYAKHVVVIRNHAVARKAIQLFNSLTQEMLLGETDPADVLDFGESKLLALSSRIHTETEIDSKGFWDLAEVTPIIEQQFKNFHAGISTGAPTGMKELDEMLEGGGLQPKGVYLIGASEKTGKTSLALDWAQHGAVTLGLTVPIVTLEMSKETMAKRMYSAYTGIPFYRFRPGFYDSATDNSYTRAVEGLQEFSKFPIKIADGLFGLDEIGRNLRRVCEQGDKVGKPVKYAVIDYLQLVLPSAPGKTREQEVSGISRGLKMLATELNIALVIMSSLNREGLGEGQEPSPRNLRDSGALAFDVEALMFLHNPLLIPGKPYTPTPVTDIQFILSLQRNGPTGRFLLKFIGPYMQFMTEQQYALYQRKSGTNLPMSVGQALDEDREMDKLWDSGNETKDRDGPDVSWD
jgi:replicative DNA helicase